MTRSDTAPIVRTLPAPTNYLCGLTWDGARLWHSDQDAQRIYAMDPVSGALTHTLTCDRVRADLAFDGKELLQVGGYPKRLLRIDPESGAVAGEKQVRPPSGRLTGVEFGPEGLWLVLRGPTVIQLRDYETMRVQREFPTGGESPSGLTYVDGMVVHGDFDEALLRVVDAQTGALLGSFHVPGRPTGLTWDGEHLWYCDFPARSLRAIDLAAALGRT
ncbi:hypothetical protein D5S18_22320 [Nocardia panacis]|uniref:Glutaminyl-peptide cyclotransferase n=2 Tax=Nocardia panacis TaxID=2340916 RepID=A0A3A4JZD3_9NOCA|nr:hypothetical protein D5S18_22320 [Nocardia panacis]